MRQEAWCPNARCWPEVTPGRAVGLLTFSEQLLGSQLRVANRTATFNCKGYTCVLAGAEKISLQSVSQRRSKS